MMKTYQLAPSDVTKSWILIDATDMVVGRLASLLALRLRGKHRADYTPHVDCGDHVIVINADKVVFTGKNKRTEKRYYRHTGYPGGIKETTPEKILTGAHPTRVLELAVRRMLPRGPLGRAQMSHLRIYAGPTHPHEAQSPQQLDLAKQNRKNRHAA